MNKYSPFTLYVVRPLGATALGLGTAAYVLAPILSCFDAQDAPDAPPVSSISISITAMSSNSATLLAWDTVLDTPIDMSPGEGPRYIVKTKA